MNNYHEENEILKKRISELESQNNDLNKILDTINDGSYLLDKNWDFTYLNSSAEKTVNKSKQELLGKNIWETFPEVKSHIFYKTYHEAMEQKKTISIEDYYPHLNKWFEVVMQPLNDKLLVSYVDITQIKMLESLSGNDDISFRFLAETIPQLVWTTDAEGWHDYFNQRWYDYTGMNLEETQGWGWSHLLHPDDRERTIEVWNNCLKTGTSYEIEYRFKDKNGYYRWFIGAALPLKDENGEIIRWFGTCTDIHYQKIMESKNNQLLKQLELEKNKLNNIFINAPAGIALFNGSKHEFEFINELYAKIIKNSDVIGKTINDIFSGTEYNNVEEIFKRIYSDEQLHISYEVPVYIDDNSSESYFNFVYQPYFNQENEIAGISIFAFDVTEQVISRKKIEQITKALEASNKSLEQFASVASHDLKAPLRVIIGYSNLLNRKYKDIIDNEGNDFINFIADSAKRLDNLINDLLEHSKITREKKDYIPINLNNIVAIVLSNLKPFILENDAKIIYSDLPTLAVNENQMISLFQNLIDNAIKYRSEQPPIINISAEKDHNEWHFSIADNGLGFNKVYSDKVFEIFQRLHSDQKGTGIGLASVKKIVELHGGKIWVESEEGKGSIFHFILPE